MQSLQKKMRDFKIKRTALKKSMKKPKRISKKSKQLIISSYLKLKKRERSTKKNIQIQNLKNKNLK